MRQKNLFIIGNGFDIAHGIPTSYKRFHDFLKGNYYDGELDDMNSPEPFMTQDGDYGFHDQDVVGFLRTIISNAEQDGENWSNVESSLGKLEFGSFLDNWLNDEEDEENEWQEADRVAGIAKDISQSTVKIRDFFKEWIDSIELSGVNTKFDFLNLIDSENDLFLTFNYTATLEVVYNVKNVCHIHGEQGDVILFGHGDDRDYTDDYMEQYPGAEYDLQNLHETLRKDTKNALMRNQDFFNTLSKDVGCIYSFGFSFSDVDMPYIKEICTKIDTSNITWYLNDFDNVSISNEFVTKIINCGFKGDFKTFSVIR